MRKVGNMTIESSPAEMVPAHDTLRPEAETSAQTPRAKRKTASRKPGKTGASKSRKSGASRSTRKTSKARPPKKSKRASKKASPRSSKGVATKTRSGKKITRTKAGGKGVLAAKGLHLLVVRVPAKVHGKAWKKAKKLGIPLNRWLNTLIAKAAS